MTSDIAHGGPHGGIREIDLLDAEVWDLPRRLSAPDCFADTGADGLRNTRNPDDDPRETDR